MGGMQAHDLLTAGIESEMFGNNGDDTFRLSENPQPEWFHIAGGDGQDILDNGALYDLSWGDIGSIEVLRGGGQLTVAQLSQFNHLSGHRPPATGHRRRSRPARPDRKLG
ncbi:hypothetical protein [Thalassovita taeanensis]|uniref:Uncharacterized protein n=1 Tax=Thalassovita taeanensis TaxID=657014 RepID=A0A1H9KYJ7_9RHOB|nr:hypothetical protein [Thalassovita taeanensis]SER04148.1 hypothetical protein SAMN04488092_12131 [Thalassovita taeanensis]